MRNVLKLGAAAATVGALILGAKAISSADTPSPASAAGINGTAVPSTNAPSAGRPPFASDVTGATLDRLKSVATAKYPGTVERAMTLPDGSYVVHVIQSGGREVHVHVSGDFRVTGVQRGGPPGFGHPDDGPPSGSSAGRES